MLVCLAKSLAITAIDDVPTLQHLLPRRAPRPLHSSSPVLVVTSAWGRVPFSKHLKLRLQLLWTVVNATGNRLLMPTKPQPVPL